MGPGPQRPSVTATTQETRSPPARTTVELVNSLAESARQWSTGR